MQLHFTLSSRHMTAAEIAGWLCLDPDDVQVVDAGPGRPVRELWRISSRRVDAGLDAQLTDIVIRLRPYQYAIAQLGAELAADDPEGGAALHLEPAGAVHPNIRSAPDHVESDPLLAWCQGRAVLDFLLVTEPAFDPTLYSPAPR